MVSRKILGSRAKESQRLCPQPRPVVAVRTLQSSSSQEDPNANPAVKRRSSPVFPGSLQGFASLKWDEKPGSLILYLQPSPVQNPLSVT